MAAPIIPCPRTATRAQAIERIVGPIAGPFTSTLQTPPVVLFDTAGGARVWTLPAVSAVPTGTEIEAKIAVAGNNVTATPVGADTVDGAGTYSFTGKNVTAARLSSDGVGNWNVIATSV